MAINAVICWLFVAHQTANRQQLTGWNPSRASSKFPSLRELTLHGVDTDDTAWYTLFSGLPLLPVPRQTSGIV